LRRGNQVEVLAAKSGITLQLTGVNSASAMLQNLISYDLEVDSALDQRILLNLEKISGEDKAEYNLLMHDVSGLVRTTSPFISPVKRLRNFEIYRKKDNTLQAELAVYKVQVNIKLAGSDQVDSPATKKMENGSFTFQYHPSRAGDYKIEVLVNGRHVKDSPFNWEVYATCI